MDYARLLQIYSRLRAVLEKNQFAFRVIGGQASIKYRLSEFTKDLDIGIQMRSGELLISLLNDFTEDGCAFKYRSGLGSPLDDRWASGGWTSHFEIVSGITKARLDVFTVLPRVPTQLTFKGGISDLHILAETKKTQRAKDWDIVRSIAVRMIEEGDLLGFLHLFDAEVLIDFQSRGIVAPSFIKALRPALILVEQSPHLLEGALTIEKMFWQKWDHVRLKTYLNSSKPYYASLLTEKNEIAALDLMEQHKALVRHAASLLPVSPYLETSVASLIDGILNELFSIFPRSLEKYLPNLGVIVHADGVYNELPEDI